MSKWNPEIPFNWRTGVFCFLMGAVLSVPVGFFPDRYFLFEPPEFIARQYPLLVSIAFCLLPVWSFFVVVRYEPLPRIGGLTFALGLVAGLLFPALAT